MPTCMGQHGQLGSDLLQLYLRDLTCSFAQTALSGIQSAFHTITENAEADTLVELALPEE